MRVAPGPRARRRFRRGLVAAVVAFVALVADPLGVLPRSAAATPPILPFDDTGDLYFVDDVTDQVLKATPAGAVSVVVTKAQIQSAIPNTTLVEFVEPSLAFDASGSLYFMVRLRVSGTDRYTLFRRSASGALVVFTTAQEIESATGVKGAQAQNFAIGPNGTIYLAEETADAMVQINGANGDASLFASKTKLVAAVGGSAVSLDANPVVDPDGTVHVPNEHSPSEIFSITPSGSVSVVPDKVNEIQSVTTNATSGSFRLRFGGADTAPLGVSATAAQVESALEALPSIDDVAVRGAGRAADPWLVEFRGPSADTDVAVMTVTSAALTPSTATVTVVQEIAGGRLADVDTFVTRRADGRMTLVDDTHSWIFDRATSGAVTSLYSRYQLVAAAGQPVRLDGGLAWGDDGRLYLADDDSDRIYRFAPDGTATRFVTGTAVRAATGADTHELDGGLAFAPGTDGTPTTTTTAPPTTTTTTPPPPPPTTTTTAPPSTTTTTTAPATTTTTAPPSTTTTTSPFVTPGDAPTGAPTAPPADPVEPQAAAPAPPAAPVDDDEAYGYLLAAADGRVHAFGVEHRGDLAGHALNAPVTGITMTPSGEGYWLVARDGGIFSFGDARFRGSTGSTPLNAPIVGMEATPTGDGYWLFAADGGVFTFGDAAFVGSTGGIRLNRPIVGMEATGTGRGYWLVASDGGVFAFGDAVFLGAAAGAPLNEPVLDLAARADGSAYWLAARDGGVFTFPAAAPFFGAAVGQARGTVVGVDVTPTGRGYWIADATGRVVALGDARHVGDLAGGVVPAGRIVGFGAVQP